MSEPIRAGSIRLKLQVTQLEDRTTPSLGWSMWNVLPPLPTNQPESWYANPTFERILVTFESREQAAAQAHSPLVYFMRNYDQGSLSDGSVFDPSNELDFVVFLNPSITVEQATAKFNETPGVVIATEDDNTSAERTLLIPYVLASFTPPEGYSDLPVTVPVVPDKQVIQDNDNGVAGSNSVLVIAPPTPAGVVPDPLERGVSVPPPSPSGFATPPATASGVATNELVVVAPEPAAPLLSAFSESMPPVAVSSPFVVQPLVANPVGAFTPTEPPVVSVERPTQAPVGFSLPTVAVAVPAPLAADNGADVSVFPLWFFDTHPVFRRLGE